MSGETALQTRSGGGLDASARQQMAQVAAGMARLERGMTQMQTAMLAQAAEIAKLNRALDSVRVSRTQELALQEAIRARARAISREAVVYGGQEKRIANAIRTTLREVTGARAMGDVQAGQFDRCMQMIGEWHMAGALRRIARENAAATANEVRYGCR